MDQFLKLLVLISGILLCNIGCTTKRPPVLNAQPPTAPARYHTLAEDSSAVSSQTLADTKWTQAPANLHYMQKQKLDAQFTTAPEQLTLEQDAAQSEALQQEAKFQKTIRLEQMKMQTRARLYRLDNKGFTLPQVSLIIDNPFKPS